VFAGYEQDEKKHICLAFYVAYCKSEERIEQSKKVFTAKPDLKEKDFFMPLTADWFIRPLFHLEHLQAHRPVILNQAIL
jgi:hypothetical protein